MINPNSKILKLARNAKSLDLDKMRRGAVKANESEIVDLNRQQIRHGVSSDGTPFRSYRPGPYGRWKATFTSYLASYPTPDLFLTGTFVNSFIMDLKGKVIDLFSTDKSKDLSHYKAEGLTQDSKEKAKIPVTNTYIKDVATALRK